MTLLKINSVVVFLVAFSTLSAQQPKSSSEANIKTLPVSAITAPGDSSEVKMRDKNAKALDIKADSRILDINQDKSSQEPESKTFIKPMFKTPSVADSEFKTTPPNPDFFSPLFFDGFEHHQNFALSFEPWTQIDLDGLPTYTINGVRFPNDGYVGSFIIFNPANTDPPLDGEWAPRTGDKYAACFAAFGGPNDDWLISPQINLGDDSALSFWAKSVTDEYGLERFRLGISNSGTNPSDFKIISAEPYVEAPVEWTQYNFPISAYDGQSVYIAINCVSNDAFAFFVDDFAIYTDGVEINIFEGEYAHFTDASSPTPDIWNWQMPGGTPDSSTEQNPSILYNVAGTYDVALTASNAFGSNSITKNNYVNVTGREPIANFYIIGFDGFVNDRYQPFIPKESTVQFLDASTRMPTSWSWTFRSGLPGSSSLQNPPEITYSNQGRFDVSLEVTNNFGGDLLNVQRLINVGCCDYITNIWPSDGLTYYGLEVDGYLPGHNAYEMPAYAEKFTTTHSGEIDMVDLLVVFADGNSDVVVSVWDDVGGYPGSLLGSKTMPISAFTPLEWNVVAFDSPVPVSGNFFVGYQISYDTPHDFENHMFLVAMVQDRGPGAPESMYAFYDGWWDKVDDLFGGLASALAVIPHFCYAGAEIMTYHIASSSGDNGNIQPEGSIPVVQGNNSTFDIVPNFGYHVADVLINNFSVGPVETYTFENVWDNHSIYASFALNNYEIRAIAGPNGSISPEGDVSVPHGGNITFDIIPNEGYQILDVVVDGVSVGAPESYAFSNVTDNHTINAYFSVITHMIYASSGPNGEIMPEGDVEVDHRSNPPFSILPNDGYYVGNVYVDGESVMAVNEYQFNNVTSDHTINAIFTNSDLPGDVNEDGVVDVRDLVWLVNHINGASPANFIIRNADLNNDGIIDLADLTQLISNIMGAKSETGFYNISSPTSETAYYKAYNSGPNPYGNYAPANNSEKPSLTINNDEILLNSEGNLTALHFEIRTDNTAEIKAKMILPGYKLSCNAKEEIYSCVIYSLSLTPFPKGETNLVSIEGLDFDNDISWNKIEASDLNHQTIKLEGLFR